MRNDERTGRRVRELQLGHDREKNTRWLFERYFPAVRQLFARWGYSPEECSDLAQDTFLKAFQSVEGFQHGSSFETWLFHIAHNARKNDLRSRSTLKRDAEVVSLSDHTAEGDWQRDTETVDPETRVLNEERTRLKREALKVALARLPRQMRRCCILRIGQGLKYREIAVILGVSMNTVRALLHGARKRLREEMAGKYPDLES